MNYTTERYKLIQTKMDLVFTRIAKHIINKEGTYCINYLKKSSVAQRN